MLKRFASLSLILAAPLAAQDADQPAPEPETVEVVLETARGDILVALETGRAPITAGNFLRYVDQGRFDGTVFYRVMKLNWGTQPNGLIQGGTQFDPARILPPIPHEPTSVTGVRHTRGALSMARNDPGTATGDFSIMMQDIPSMNADPRSPEPEWQAGYAAFGHVIAGMEVVEDIYYAPIDPEAGEGFLQGQMLAGPVPIVRARRATAEDLAPQSPPAEAMEDTAASSDAAASSIEEALRDAALAAEGSPAD